MHNGKYLLYHQGEVDDRMRLESHGVELGGPLMNWLREELGRRYQRMIERLDTSRAAVLETFEAGSLGERSFTFQIRYAQDGRGRNPALVLEPLAGTRPRPVLARKRAPTQRESIGDLTPAEQEHRQSSTTLVPWRAPRVPTEPLPWIEALLREVDDCLQRIGAERLSDVDMAGLEFVLKRFERLCRERADVLPLVILAGHLALCEASYPPASQEEAMLMGVAGQALDRLAGRPADSGGPPRAAGSPKTGHLRRITQMLARVLGLDDTGGG